MNPTSLLIRELHPDLHDRVILFGGRPVIRSYFGGGSRIHALIQLESGLWTSACNPDFWGFDFDDEEERLDERLLPRDNTTPPNCMRCLKQLGIITRYPGPDKRRTFNLANEESIAYWKNRAKTAETLLKLILKKQRSENQGFQFEHGNPTNLLR